MKASTVMLGNMEIEELKEILNNDKTLFEYRAKRLFVRMDENKSGDLDQNEIKSYFKEAMGADYSEE